MNLLLICETAIIEHIFLLICKKLNIDLTIQKTNNVSEKFDFIVVDQNFIDDRFNIIKQFSRKLGAISSEELPFDKSRDFIIPRPFLPTKLEQLLKEQIEVINEDNVKEKIALERRKETKIIDDEYPEDDEVTVPILDFVESLAEDVYADLDEDDNDDTTDESIVNYTSLNKGGVLDLSELSKINEILREDSIHNDINLEKTDWKNISDIIDEALEEVKEYEFNLEKTTPKPYNLVLSNFHINELRPLLEKFDQTIIDKLSSGESVNVILSLKEK